MQFACLACLPACLLGNLLALPACLPTCLLACLHACLHACLLACLLAYLLACLAASCLLACIMLGKFQQVCNLNSFLRCRCVISDTGRSCQDPDPGPFIWTFHEAVHLAQPHQQLLAAHGLFLMAVLIVENNGDVHAVQLEDRDALQLSHTCRAFSNNLNSSGATLVISIISNGAHRSFATLISNAAAVLVSCSKTTFVKTRRCLF